MENTEKTKGNWSQLLGKLGQVFYFLTIFFCFIFLTSKKFLWCNLFLKNFLAIYCLVKNLKLAKKHNIFWVSLLGISLNVETSESLLAAS